MPATANQIPSLSELRKQSAKVASATKSPTTESSDIGKPSLSELMKQSATKASEFTQQNEVKKKDGTEDAGANLLNGEKGISQSTSILASPTVNTPKTKQQVSGEVQQIVNDHYQGLVAQQAQSKQDFKPIVKGAQNGDPASIALLRNKISALYDQQISAITNKPEGIPNIPVSMIQMAPGQSVLSPAQNAQVKELTDKKNQVVETLNQYGSFSTTNQYKKLSNNSVDKIDFTAMGKAYSQHFGDEEQSRLERLASKSTTPQGKIVNENMNFKYTAIGINNAIQDTESDLHELNQKLQSDPSIKVDYDKKLQALSKLYGKRDSILDQFPEVRRQYVAQILGDKISDDNKVFNLYVSKSDIKKAADKLQEEHPNLPANFKGDVEELLNRTGGFFGDTSPVPNQGFLGSFNRATASLDQNLKGFFGIGVEENRAAETVSTQASAFMKGTSKSGQSPSTVTIKEDGSAYIPVDNSENFHKLNFNNAARILGSAIPTVAPFVITEALTGGVGGFVGGLGGDAAIAGGVPFIGAQAAAQAARARDMIGKTSAFFVTGYNENHERAGELIKGDTSMDSAKRAAVATLMTMGDMLAFEAVGTNMSQVVKGSIKRAAAKDIVDFIDKNAIENLSKKETFSALQDAYVPRLLTALGKGAGKMGAASALQVAFKDAITGTIDPNTKTATGGEYLDAIVEGAITGIGLGLPGHIATSAEGGISKLNRDALMEAGLNSDKYIQRINDNVESGAMDRNQANNNIKIIQTVRQEVENPENYIAKDGNRIPDRKASRIIADRFIQRAAEMIPDKAKQEEARNAAQSRIDGIKDQEYWVNVDETPIINDLSIHPVDEEKGGQVKSFKDIDAGENYRVMDGEKEKKMSGADVIELINEKASEYEHLKEEDTGKESDTAEKSAGEVGDTGTEGEKGPEVSVNKFTPEQEAHVMNFVTKDHNKVQEILDRVNKGEPVNENEILDAADNLDNLSKTAKNDSLTNLINPLIDKLLGYENQTKTETRTVTEKESVKVARPSGEQRPVSKSLEQWDGSRASYTGADGKSVEGVLKSEDGKYVIYNTEGDKVAALGEKAITDRDVTLPSKEDVPSPITVDTDGNVKSITLQLNKTDKENGGTVKGGLVTLDFKYPDKALDYAIQLRGEEIGDVSDPDFENAYQEVTKEIKEEVPAGNNQSQSKTENNGNEKNDEKGREENGQESGSQESQGQDGEKDGKNAGDVNQPEGATDKGAPSTEKSNTNESSENTEQEKTESVNAEGSDQGVGQAESTPAKATSESTNTEDRLITGIRNSVIDKENMNAEVEPYYKAIRSRWSDLWSAVSKDVESGILDTAQFVREKLDAIHATKGNVRKKVVLSDFDNAILLYDRVRLLNDLKNRESTLKDVQEKLKFDDSEENKYAHEKLKQDIRSISDSLKDGEEVLRETGTTGSQALASRKMMADMFGNLVSWEDYINTQYDGNPPPEMLRKARAYQELHKKIQGELKVFYEENLQRVADEAYKKGLSENPKDSSAVKKEKNKQRADKLRAAADKVEKFTKGHLGEDGAQTQGVDIQKLVADAMRYIADGIENDRGIGKLINEAVDAFKGESDGKELRDRVKFILKDSGFELEQDKLLANIKDDATANKSTSIVTDSVNDIKKLMNGLLRDGEAGSLQELLAKTKELLNDSYPDATERELRDLYSGYGIRAELRSDVEKRIYETKQQAKMASELEDLLKPVANETPLQEKSRYDKINKLLPKVEEYMRSKGVSIEVAPYNDTNRVQMALDNTTNSVKGLIDSIDERIATASKAFRDINEPVDTNPNIISLKEERDNIEIKLNEINNSNGTGGEKIRKIDDLLRENKLSLDKKLRDGTDPLTPDKNLSKSEQFELKERIKNYTKQLAQLKEDLIPDAEKQTGALKTYHNTLEQQIDKMERKIRERNFSDPIPKEEKDFTKDAKAVMLELKANTIKNDYYKLKRVADEHGQSTYKKTLGVFNNYVRFNVLSNYMTLVKLGMAVAENMVFTPVEQAIGMGYTLASEVPYLGEPFKKLMQKGDRHGSLGLSTYAKSEWSALRATFTKGLKDSWQELSNHNSELGILYGDESYLSDVPAEYKDTWHTINDALGIAARLHGAEKAFFKRNEFTRSYLLRKDAALRKGKNVNDPVLQHEMAMAAYNDGMTSILLGDNKLYNIYQKGIKALRESGNPYSNGLASLASFLTPIVKVPSNLVLMGGRASFGWLAGAEIGVRSMVELMRPDSKLGISRLTDQEADALLRNLKKGSLGIGLITLGFIRPDMFGSSTIYKQGVTGDNDLEEGEATFFGIHMPRWATDNPYFWAMKIGASARKFYDYYTDQKGKNTANAIGRTAWDVAIGGITEIPTLGTWSNLSSVVKNPDSKYASNFLYNQLTKISPASGFTGQLAKDTDRDSDGRTIKRSPQTIGEAFEAKWPGLRQNVQPK